MHVICWLGVGRSIPFSALSGLNPWDSLEPLFGNVKSSLRYWKCSRVVYDLARRVGGGGGVIMRRPWCLQFPDKEIPKSTRELNLAPLCAYLSASGLEEYTCINVDNMQPNMLQRATESQEGNIVSNPYTTGTESSPSMLPDSHEYAILFFYVGWEF